MTFSANAIKIQHDYTSYLSEEIVQSPLKHTYFNGSQICRTFGDPFFLTK